MTNRKKKRNLRPAQQPQKPSSWLVENKATIIQIIGGAALAVIAGLLRLHGGG